MSNFKRLGVVIPGITLCVFLLTAALGLYISRQIAFSYTYSELTEHLRDRATYIQGTARQFMELNMQDRLQQMISSFAAESDLVSIHIIDRRDQVIASSLLGDVGLTRSELTTRFQDPLIAGVRGDGNLALDFDAENNILEAYASLCGDSGSAALRQRECGFINYRISLGNHMQVTSLAMSNLSTFYLLGTGVVVLVNLGLLHVLVARRTRSISSLLSQFGEGRRQARLKIGRRDEIGVLSDSINSLLDEIVEDEKFIRDGHERLHALVDNITDSVIVINKQGLIESTNPATERVFGYAPGELPGQNVRILMPEPVRSEHDQYLLNYYESGIPKIIGGGRQVEALHKSGRCFPVDLTVSEMYVHGQRLFTGILRDISEQVALSEKINQALEDLRVANARLEESARTDKLTNLFNRGYFDEVLFNEIQRATRNHIPLSLILMDVDYFKRFNDHYGHPEGDRCLQDIARALQEVFLRSGEVVTRYGGEEFAIILPHCDTDNATGRAKELLHNVWNKAIPHEKSGVSDRVTVSIGVVTYHPQSTRPIKPGFLVRAADEMLYKAKAAGRNRFYHDVLLEKHDVLLEKEEGSSA